MENPAPKKSWLARFWWVIILALLLLGGLSTVCCVGTGVLGIFSLMKSSPVFRDSLAMVQENPDAREYLGEPIQAGWLVSGEISETPSGGTAEISYPVSGPRGSGTVYVTAKKAEGEWIILRLVLVMDKTKQKLILVGSG
jgi:Cytochrome oxidase complex assembly protein 1